MLKLKKKKKNENLFLDIWTKKIAHETYGQKKLT